MRRLLVRGVVLLPLRPRASKSIAAALAVTSQALTRSGCYFPDAPVLRVLSLRLHRRVAVRRRAAALPAPPASSVSTLTMPRASRSAPPSCWCARSFSSPSWSSSTSGASSAAKPLLASRQHLWVRTVLRGAAGRQVPCPHLANTPYELRLAAHSILLNHKLDHSSSIILIQLVHAASAC